MSRAPMTTAAAIGLLFLCTSALGASDGDAEAAWSEADQAFVRACYGCPVDPESGSLYPSVIELLAAAHGLPGDIVLFDYVEPSEPQPVGEKPGEEVEGEEQGAEEDEQSDEVMVLETPAVGQERLAYSYYLAGRYEEAARTYRDAYETSPGDTHLLVLLALSERNAGNLKAAEELFTELQETEEHAEWAGWMLDTLKGFQREGEQE